MRPTRFPPAVARLLVGGAVVLAVCASFVLPAGIRGLVVVRPAAAQQDNGNQNQQQDSTPRSVNPDAGNDGKSSKKNRLSAPAGSTVLPIAPAPELQQVGPDLSPAEEADKISKGWQ